MDPIFWENNSASSPVTLMSFGHIDHDLKPDSQGLETILLMGINIEELRLDGLSNRDTWFAFIVKTYQLQENCNLDVPNHQGPSQDGWQRHGHEGCPDRDLHHSECFEPGSGPGVFETVN